MLKFYARTRVYLVSAGYLVKRAAALTTLVTIQEWPMSTVISNCLFKFYGVSFSSSTILLKYACCQNCILCLFTFWWYHPFLFRLHVSRKMITSPIFRWLLLFYSENTPPYVPTAENNTIKQELQNMAPWMSWILLSAWNMLRKPAMVRSSWSAC